MRMTFKRVRMLFISCHLSGKFFFSEKNLSCDYSGLIYFCLDICQILLILFSFAMSIFFIRSSCTQCRGEELPIQTYHLLTGEEKEPICKTIPYHRLVGRSQLQNTRNCDQASERSNPRKPPQCKQIFLINHATS